MGISNMLKLIEAWTTIDSDEEDEIEYLVHIKYIDNSNYSKVIPKNNEE